MDNITPTELKRTDNVEEQLIKEYNDEVRKILHKTEGKIDDNTFNQIKELKEKAISQMEDEKLKGKIIMETQEITEDMKKHIELKGSLYKNNDLELWQKKSLVNILLNFLKRKFGKPFSEVILTNESNFYTTSHLAKCHHFLKCLKMENIYWPATFFDRNMYGQMVCRIFLNETDYIDFMSIEKNTATTIKFSFDVLGNTFCLAYPYPKDIQEECERDMIQQEEFEKELKKEEHRKEMIKRYGEVEKIKCGGCDKMVDNYGEMDNYGFDSEPCSICKIRYCWECCDRMDKLGHGFYAGDLFDCEKCYDLKNKCLKNKDINNKVI